MIVVPVQVRSGIGLRRPNLMEVRSGGLCDGLGQAGGLPAGGKVSDKGFHGKCSFLLQTLGVLDYQTCGLFAVSRVFCAITPTRAWGV